LALLHGGSHRDDEPAPRHPQLAAGVDDRLGVVHLFLRQAGNRSGLRGSLRRRRLRRRGLRGSCRVAGGGLRGRLLRGGQVGVGLGVRGGWGGRGGGCLRRCNRRLAVRGPGRVFSLCALHELRLGRNRIDRGDQTRRRRVNLRERGEAKAADEAGGHGQPCRAAPAEQVRNPLHGTVGPDQELLDRVVGLDPQVGHGTAGAGREPAHPGTHSRSCAESAAERFVRGGLSRTVIGGRGAKLVIGGVVVTHSTRLSSRICNYTQ
jgi:hypothetical protein